MVHHFTARVRQFGRHAFSREYREWEPNRVTARCALACVFIHAFSRCTIVLHIYARPHIMTAFHARHTVCHMTRCQSVAISLLSVFVGITNYKQIIPRSCLRTRHKSNNNSRTRLGVGLMGKVNCAVYLNTVCNILCV